MMCLRWFLCFAALAWIGCADTATFPPAPDARDLRATEGIAPWPDLGPSIDYGGLVPGGKMYAHSKTQLFAIDPATLKLTPIGSFGSGNPDINDLAVTPDGKIFACSVNDLWQVDRQTAALTHVTKVQGTANVALTFEVAGTLLASDKSGMLRRIDPKTGAVQEIGPYGNGMSASGDMVAIKDGTLFGVNDGDGADQPNQLITIDPKTGKATIVGSIGYHHVWGLAYWRGTVYGLTRDGQLLGIDPKTGKGTLIETFSHQFWGAAVTPLAPIE
jgi:outer membrane protein assembly factor BamB